MRACIYCKTRYQKGNGVTFHKFPSDSTKNDWLKNMKIDDWSPKTNDHLCSKHFTDDCFIKHAARTTLKSGSVPTNFFSDSSLSMSTEKARPPNDGCHGQKVNDITLETVSNSVTDPSVGESACNDMVTPILFVSTGIKREFCSVDVNQENINPGESSLFLSTEKARPSNDGCHGQRVNDVILETVSHSVTDPLVCESARDDMVTPTLNVLAGIKREFCSIDVNQENINPGEPSTSGIQKKLKSPEVCKIIKHDHNYTNTPKCSTKSARDYQKIKKSLKISRARVKVLSQHVKRLQFSVSCLKTIIAQQYKRQ